MSDFIEKLSNGDLESAREEIFAQLYAKTNAFMDEKRRFMDQIGAYGRKASFCGSNLHFMDEICTYGRKTHFLLKKKNTSQ